MSQALGSELGGQREVHTEFNVHVLLKRGNMGWNGNPEHLT